MHYTYMSSLRPIGARKLSQSSNTFFSGSNTQLWQRKKCSGYFALSAAALNRRKIITLNSREVRSSVRHHILEGVKFDHRYSRVALHARPLYAVTPLGHVVLEGSVGRT